MKTIQFFITILCLCFFFEAGAQNRSIEFRQGDWSSILKTAKKEKKTIFVDCYTSWCGPCKMLAKNVFTQDSVADFYNKHFVCVKIDMEKGEGPELAKRYGVGAYPTLLYVGADGKLQHCVAGYMPPATLIEHGRNVLSKTLTLENMQTRYEAGEREDSFVKEYMEVLYKACRPSLQKEVATEYIDRLDERQFYTRETWNIIVKHLSDPLSPILKKVLKTKYRFETFIAPDSVELFLNYTLSSAVSRFIWQNYQKRPLDQERYDALLAYLFTVHLPNTPQYIASMYAAKKAAEEDLRGMWNEMRQSLAYGIFYSTQSKLNFIQGFMRKLEVSEDQTLIKECNAWLDSFIQNAETGYEKSEYMKIKARLLRALGEKEKAEKLEEEAPKVRMSY